MQVNDHFLTDVGLDALPEAVKPAYLRRVYEDLTHSIGMRLARDMTEEQLEEFDALRDGPRCVAVAWLHINFPSYPRVVAEEFAAARRRLADQAPQILALELALQADPNSHHAPAPVNADPKES